MGWFEHHREHVAEKQAEERRQVEQETFQSWEQEERALKTLIETATTFTGLPDAPIDLRRGESRFFTLASADLVEPRRGPGHRVGGYSGPSFRIARGVYWHMGRSASTYIPGEERPTVIDSGTAVVTNLRVVFTGTKQARELLFAKLIAYEHDAEAETTSFQMSNRQRVTGIGYGDVTAWCFAVDLAHAHFTETVPAFVAELNRQLVEHEAARPQVSR
jgi:hypothetical protein